MNAHAPTLGVLGGTFDPPHRAHIAMALLTRERLGLDRVALVPAMNPPHKDSAVLTPYNHRVRMAELAVSDVEGVDVMAVDEPGDVPSYTVDLLRKLHGEFRDGLYFILGADSFNDLKGWRDPEGILSLCTVVVFAREGANVVNTVAGDAAFVVFEEPVGDVSSTEVRKLLSAGVATDDVPIAVREYAAEHQLY